MRCKLLANAAVPRGAPRRSVRTRGSLSRTVRETSPCRADPAEMSRRRNGSGINPGNAAGAKKLGPRIAVCRRSARGDVSWNAGGLGAWRRHHAVVHALAAALMQGPNTLPACPFSLPVADCRLPRRSGEDRHCGGKTMRDTRFSTAPARLSRICFQASVSLSQLRRSRCTRLIRRLDCCARE